MNRQTQRIANAVEALLAIEAVHAGDAKLVRHWATLAAHSARRYLRNRAARLNRQSRDEAYRACGLVKVRGALGGTYWE